MLKKLGGYMRHMYVDKWVQYSREDACRTHAVREDIGNHDSPLGAHHPATVYISLSRATRARDPTRLAVSTTSLEHPTFMTVSRAMDSGEVRRDVPRWGAEWGEEPRKRIGEGERARARSTSEEAGRWGNVAEREKVWQTGGRGARDVGKVYGSREGALPPCRPPAVRATRYH